MTKLLLDEMLSGDIADQLRRRGLDCSAVVERRDLLALPDERLLAVAAAEHRCLVTANIKDFIELAARWLLANRTHHGLIHLTNNAFPRTSGLPGALVKALTRAELPEPNQELFLRPVS